MNERTEKRVKKRKKESNGDEIEGRQRIGLRIGRFVKFRSDR